MQGNGTGTSVALDTSGTVGRWDHPPRCEAQGDGAAVVLRERESRVHGEGWQVSGNPHSKVREMRNAEPMLGIMHDRGTALLGPHYGRPPAYNTGGLPDVSHRHAQGRGDTKGRRGR